MLYSRTCTSPLPVGHWRRVTSCRQPKYRPCPVGSSVLMPERMSFQPSARLAFGPDNLKSSTYTTRNKCRRGCQKQLRHAGMSSKPTECRCFSQCRSQNPPLSGCPYKDRINGQTGFRMPAHEGGHSSRGKAIHVRVPPRRDWVYACSASEHSVPWPSTRP